VRPSIVGAFFKSLSGRTTMSDSLFEGHASNAEDASDAPESSRDAKRERLINDLAYLVVRQHQHRQRAASGDDSVPIQRD
jgi:hypothetical protein